MWLYADKASVMWLYADKASVMWLYADTEELFFRNISNEIHEVKGILLLSASPSTPGRSTKNAGIFAQGEDVGLLSTELWQMHKSVDMATWCVAKARRTTCKINAFGRLMRAVRKMRKSVAQWLRAFIWCRYNAGPASPTVAQHCTGTRWTSSVSLGVNDRGRLLSLWLMAILTPVTVICSFYRELMMKNVVIIRRVLWQRYKTRLI